jgi:hypothetical protein
MQSHATAGRVAAFFLIAAAGALSASAPAQSVFSLPPNVLLPNNESLPVGSVSGLEGNAFTARADDSTSLWFNPAGVARASQSSASVSGGSFRFLGVTPDGTTNSGGSTQQLPSAVGIVVKKAFRSDAWSLGFTVVRTAAWRQETDAEIFGSGTVPSRTAFSADASFDRTSVGISAGWSDGGRLRLGAGLIGDVLSLRSVSMTSIRQLPNPTTLDTAVGSNRITGSQGMLRLALGAQYDASPSIRLGAVVRTPGVQILPGATYAADGLVESGGASKQYSFLDSETASFRYKLPVEAVAAVAWVSKNVEIEADLKWQSAVSPYAGFSSPRNVLIATDPGNGTPIVVSSSPFLERTFELKNVWNVSLGGRVALDEKQVWKLHAGFATDRSPVGDSDTFFSRVDLYAATVGITGEAFHIGGSLGVTYQFGRSDERTVPILGGGQVTLSKYTISNFGILYSASYRF